MLTAQNLLPTSVRYYGAERTESAAPYMNFFLERYTPAYRAELDHFITSIENGTTAVARIRGRSGGAGPGRRRQREPADRRHRAGRPVTAAI